MIDRYAALMDAIEVNPAVVARIRDALPENQPLTREMFAQAVRQAGHAFEPEDLPDTYKGQPVADALLGQVVGGGPATVFSLDGALNGRRMPPPWNFLCD